MDNLLLFAQAHPKTKAVRNLGFFTDQAQADASFRKRGCVAIQLPDRQIWSIDRAKDHLYPPPPAPEGPKTVEVVVRVCTDLGPAQVARIIDESMLTHDEAQARFGSVECRPIVCLGA